jgi:hypothetical protein
MKKMLLRSAELMPEETDASAVQIVGLSGFDMPRLGVLSINAIHTGLHYGNFVTYLRLKDIVPPTSEPGFRP